MQPLVPLVFHNLPSLYPPSFRRNDFYTCLTDFWLCQRNIGDLYHYRPSLLILPFPCSRIYFVMQHAGIEIGPHRYDATLLTSTLCYTRSHKKPRINFQHACARRGTPSKMASFIAETRDFHSRCGIGEERSLGDDAHLWPS